MNRSAGQAARPLRALLTAGPGPLRSRRCRRGFHSNPDRSSEAAAAGMPARLPEAEPEPAASQMEPESAKRRRVTIADILERRARAGRLVAGTAAPADSDMFKAVPAADDKEKPQARRWDHHLSRESAAREPCVLKQAARHLRRPGLISLGGGLPCPEYFPIESLSFRVPSPDAGFSEAATQAAGRTARIGKYDARASSAEYDLSIALNYGQATGSAQLLRWVTEHTELVCDPPYADWQSCLTVGSTGALETALRMFCDRARGDALLTEEYSFSTALETAAPLGVPVFGVPMDDEGLLPQALDEMLAGWEPRERGGARRPHVLYTVPSGQNPTGATQGARRRREVYDVCRRHDVYILEDEPYYFLQMPPYRSRRQREADAAAAAAAAAGETTQEKADAEQSPEAFLSTLLPPLLSLDADGRVMRMDSFSKVVVPGARLGWVTASAQVVERYVRHAEVASQGPSGISQAVLHALLDDGAPAGWGHAGYLRWLAHLRAAYAGRRDAMIDACEEFLPREVVSWAVPRAGMFHWLKVDHTQHPDFAGRPGGTKSVLELEEDVFDRCIEAGALVGRGSWFRAEQANTHGTSGKKEPSALFLRTTFAAASPADMAEAIRRVGGAIRGSFRM